MSMTDEDDQVAPSQQPPDVASPGDALRRAREKAGLSIEELGQRTRIAKTTLEAMEADRFDALLEPVYVRGYYRKCAQALGIDEKPLIEAYGILHKPAPTPTPSRLRIAPSSEFESPARLPFRLGLVAPIILVVVVGAIWLVRNAPSSSSSDTSVTLIDPNAPGLVLTDALPPLTDETPEPEPAPEPEAADVPESADESADAAALDEETVAPAEPVGTTLELEFTALSWVRITDSSGKSLLSGVISEGETRSVDGRPPYSVFLGNAPGVRVRFGGQAVDTQPYTGSNAVARFTVPSGG